MSYKVGARVRIKDTQYLGTVTGVFTGSRDIGFHRVNSPAEADPKFPVWYEVELDEPHWDGNYVRGYKGKVFREFRTEDVLVPV